MDELNVENYDYLIGTTLRDACFVPMGTIVNVYIETDGYWKSTRAICVLDNGKKIPAFKVASVYEKMKG